MDALSTMRQPTVAIVGSGPSGCYVAQFLRKAWAQAEITIFDAMPAPYGLVRYGVAPDHQGTKAVTRQFDRLFERESVQFAGNVRIGHDLSFEDISESFDIVVLATGLPQDRALDVAAPGARVIGAGEMIRLLNGFPDVTAERPADGRADLGERVAVVGNGNVAMDVVRVLAKHDHELDGSDVADDVLARFRPGRLRSIDVFGRSPADLAKFDLAMVREICALSMVDVTVTGALGDPGHPAVELLLGAAAAGDADAGQVVGRTSITFHFGVEPVEIADAGSAALLTVREVSDPGARHRHEVDTVVTAIGFTHGAADDMTAPGERWSGPHVYRAGWLRTATGAMPQMRREAKEIVDGIARDVEAARITIGKPGLAAVEQRIAHRRVGFEGWLRLDAHENASAPPNRVRKKVADLASMHAIATDPTHARNPEWSTS